jgi:hypothetical protein
MATNNYPGVTPKSLGHDFNTYQVITVSASTFGGDSVDGYQPSYIITFPTYGIMLTNETSGQVVEYSLNGNTVHGVLDGLTTSTTRVVTFNNRPVSMIWFRIKSGGGPATITLTAWGNR